MTKPGFCFYVVFLMNVCFVVLGLVSSVLSQEIGWKECLWNDLTCVEWDVRWTVYAACKTCSIYPERLSFASARRRLRVSRLIQLQLETGH